MQVEFVKNNIPGLPLRVTKELIVLDNMYICPLHIHDDIEILAGYSGEMSVLMDEDEVRLKEGDIVIINRRVPHSTRCAPKTATVMIQFRIEKFRAEEFDRINKYLSYILADTEEKYVYLKSGDEITSELYSVIMKIFGENAAERSNYEIFIKGYMEILIGILYRNNILVNIEESYNKDAVAKVWPVIEYIDRNYANKLMLEELSAQLNINREYFCRIFKEATGITPMEYVNYVRIMKAEILLTTTRMSILDVALEVGFSSISYFNRIFKRQRGIAPSDYKKITYAKNRLI